jgi:hypothetical protein
MELPTGNGLCEFFYYDYDRNCCDHKDNESGRCTHKNCPLKADKNG